MTEVVTVRGSLKNTGKGTGGGREGLGVWWSFGLGWQKGSSLSGSLAKEEGQLVGGLPGLSELAGFHSHI